MRGVDRHNERLFSYVRPDSRIPRDHPLRSIRRISDAALAMLSDQFDALYAKEGRPSIPVALLVQAFLLGALGAAADGADPDARLAKKARAVQRSIHYSHGKDCTDAAEGDAVPTI